MKGRCLRSKNGLWEGKESFSPTKIQTLKSHSWKELCNKEKWETGNMTFVLTFGSYIQNVFCSYSAATGTALVKDNMLPESPLKSGISWWGEGHTDFSLTPICSQVEVCSRCLGSDRGWGGNPSRPANTGAESIAPACKNTVADGASGGNSRRVEGRLGSYILEAFTGTCHRSPAGGDGLG